VCDEVRPSLKPPKSSLGGVTAMSGSIPTPDSATSNSPSSGSSLVSRSVAMSGPSVTGSKLTVIARVASGTSVNGPPPATIENSAAVGPWIAELLTARSPVPSLRTTKTCEAPVPRSRLP
jgi:hypothetical protein